MLTNEERRIVLCTHWVAGALEELKAMGLLGGSLVINNEAYELTPKGKAGFDQIDCDIDITNEELMATIDALMHVQDAEYKTEIFLALIAFRDSRDILRQLAEIIIGSPAKSTEEDAE